MLNLRDVSIAPSALRSLFDAFLQHYGLKESISKNIARRRVLQNSELFKSIKWSPLLTKIAKSIEEIKLKPGQHSSPMNEPHLLLVESGTLRLYGNEFSEELKAGQFCFEDQLMSEHTSLSLRLKAEEASRAYLIHQLVLKDIPAVEWKLWETYKRRAQALSKIAKSKKAS